MNPATITIIQHALENSWSLQSSTLWQKDNPALGHCGVSTLVAQDFLGGEILKTRFRDIWHFYNRIEGTSVDFTSSQFTSPLVYDDILSNRNEAFTDTNSSQYDHLKSAVENCLRNGLKPVEKSR